LRFSEYPDSVPDLGINAAYVDHALIHADTSDNGRGKFSVLGDNSDTRAAV
jgi:hypothetical protein